MKFLLLKLIRAYQAITRSGVTTPLFLGGFSGCRSWPPCSEYAYNAVADGGVFRGGARAVRRLFHCHPLSSNWHMHA